MAAGKWAMETAAFEEGLAYLERAAERVDAATPSDRADLLFHLGTARRANGRWDDAIDTWTGAVDAYEALGDAETVGRIDNGLPWLSSSHSSLGLAFFFQGDWDKAHHHFETAAALEPPGKLNGWDQGLLFEFYAYAGEREAALAMLDPSGDDRMPVPGEPNGSGPWAMLLSVVESLSVLGQRDAAGRYYDLVVEGIERTAPSAPGSSTHACSSEGLASPPPPPAAGTTPRNISGSPSAKPTSCLTGPKLPTPDAGTPGCSSTGTAPATRPRLPR